MSNPIPSITDKLVRSAELIFAGPDVLHARTTMPAEQGTFRTSNQVEGR